VCVVDVIEEKVLNLGDLSQKEPSELVELVVEKLESGNVRVKLKYEGFVFLFFKSRVGDKEVFYFSTEPELVNFGATQKEIEEFKSKFNVEVLFLVEELMKKGWVYAYGCPCCGNCAYSYEEILEKILLTNYL